MTDPNDKKTEQTNRDGSTGFQTTVHGGTVNIGPHYHLAASPKPGGVDFERYIQFIRQDSRYQNVRDLYTETEALIPLEAETVERQSKHSEQDTEQAQKKVERFPVLEGLRKYALGRERQHVLLAGRPGSGKSTTLKRLLLELADEWVADSTQPVPIYIQLKRDSSPLELITDELEKGDIELEEKEIKRLLRRKRLILLLDGINEIPSEPRRRKLQEFREDHPTTPMIFTTRDLSVGGDLLGIKKRLEMLLLSDPQMRQFVGKYLSDRGMSGQTDTLLRQLHDRLREIAETPLLLEMLCDVFDPAIQQIPQSKGELFRQFDEKYDTFKGDPAVSEDSRRYRKELLRHLAFCMMQGPLDKPTEAWLTLDRNLAEKILENYLTGHVHDSGPRAREWLEDLLEHHLLQIAANPREIEFHHQLFQEYYAAEELLLRLPDLLENEPKFERDYLNLLKWTEPIALMLALMNEEKQALRVVKLAIDDVDLMLGAKLAGKLQPLSQKEAIANVIEKIRTKVTSPSCKIKLLGQTCSDYAVPILIEKLTTEKNQDLIFEAAFALKELGCRSAVQQLLPLLKHNHQLIVIAALFVLGELGGKNILPDICEALNHSEEESIREYAVEALGKLGDRTIISHLISSAKKDPSIGVREKAVEALLRLHAESALTTLIEIVSENKNISVSNLSSCWSAVKTLDQNDLENAVQALAEIIRNETDHDTRQNLVEAIGVIGGELATEELLTVICETSNAWQAAEALVEIGSKKAIPGLLNALRNSTPCEQAIYVLGELRDPVAVPYLINYIDHWHAQVGDESIEALGKIGDKRAIPSLYKLNETLSNDSGYSSRLLKRKVVISLGKLGDSRVRQELIKSLHEQAFGMIYFSDWWTIFEALERIGNLQVISELISVFESSDSNQRYQAVEVVGRLCNFLNLLDDEVVIGRIVNLLADEDYLVRAKAAEALGGFNTQKVIEKLSPKLKDETREVREAATAALGYIKTESSVLASIENLLNDQTQKVRCYAAQSLVKLSGVNIADLGVSRALSRSSKTKLLDDDLTYQLQAIQKNCKFYNYEIWQESIQYANLENQHKDQAVASQTTYIFPNATDPRIFERVDHYHENSLSMKEPPS